MHKGTIDNTRNGYVDCLRALGLLSIILVHSNCPRVLYQINLFNVPLMVFISGYVAMYANKKSYFSYIKGRLLRLIIPTYIFITCYLFFLFVLTKVGIINFFDFSIKNIFSSYMLLDSSYGGIGFVWIIRVFLLTMLVTPFAFKTSCKVKSNLSYYSILSFLIILQILLCNTENTFNKSILYDQYLLYFIGYQVFIWGGKIKAII